MADQYECTPACRANTAFSGDAAREKVLSLVISMHHKHFVACPMALFVATDNIQHQQSRMLWLVAACNALRRCLAWQSSSPQHTVRVLHESCTARHWDESCCLWHVWTRHQQTLPNSRTDVTMSSDARADKKCFSASLIIPNW